MGKKWLEIQYVESSFTWKESLYSSNYAAFHSIKLNSKSRKLRL